MTRRPRDGAGARTREDKMKFGEETTFGPVTVRRRDDDYMAYKNGDTAVWAAGRSLYEAIGDLMVHHPEHFAAQARPAPDDDAALAALRAGLKRFIDTAESIEREWNDGSITSDHMAFLLNILIQDADDARAALDAGGSGEGAT